MQEKKNNPNMFAITLLVRLNNDHLNTFISSSRFDQVRVNFARANGRAA